MTKDNVFWRTATWLLLLVVACFVVLGAYRQNEPSTKTVEAEQFVLKDSSGRTRAKLAMKDDKPRIDFYDERGNVIASLPDKGFKELGIR